jgi:hypoxanthine-DNA glycosylase
VTELALDRGFPPVAGRKVRALVLGSLPGRRSLQASQYYAQPQNAFWKIMGELFGAGPELDYAQRLARLRSQSIALWDVLAAGQRPGSLDSAIVKTTVVANDFTGFFEVHGDVRLICFNGKTAAALYAREVLPGLRAEFAAVDTVTLPSTSPAYASMRFGAKLEHWSRALSSVADG